MVDLLFNPNGRIAGGPPFQGPFWQGVLILLGANIIMQLVAAFGPAALSVVWMILGIALIYPWVCIYAKRFHDNGKTGWWVLAVIGAQIVAGMVVALIMTPILIGGAAGSTAEEIRSAMLLPNIVIAIVVNIGIAFFVARLPSEPGENRFGPPTSGAAPAEAA